MQKQILITILMVSCLLSGVFFYKLNNGDWLNAIFFSIGLTGIVLSLIRRQKSDDEDPPTPQP